MEYKKPPDHRASNEESDFRKIYDRHHNVIFHFCLKLIKSTPLAEEITSDVFVKLWERRSTIDLKKNVLGLLFKMTRDLTIDHLRKIGRNVKKRDQYIKNYSKKHTFSLEDEFNYKEYERDVQQAVSMLPAKRRKVFSMYFYDQMDKYQIANELDISPNTVKVQLTRARSFIRKYLKDHGDMEN